MPQRTAAEVLDREYLELRAKLLELAASLDRISRADGTADERLNKIDQGLAMLQDQQGSKAQRIQELFSRPWSEDWREDLGL
jgi:hypothetical protein